MKTETNNKIIKELRQAVADYIGSEGCGCCAHSNHTDHEKRLAELLKVKKYTDKSGYDFSKYKSNK